VGTKNTAAALDNPQTLDDLVLYRFARLSATAGLMVVRLCEGRFGITRREWRMLALLAESGGLHPSELADRAQLDRARTSRAVSSLVAKGLVLRAVQASDQRYAQLCLSDRGQRLHHELFPLVAGINRQLLQGLDTAEVKAMSAAVESMQAQAEAMRFASTPTSAGRSAGLRRNASAMPRVASLQGPHIGPAQTPWPQGKDPEREDRNSPQHVSGPCTGPLQRKATP